jgi:methylmalonyl-CoA/ethylmalonyl-CoA epimerase
VGVRGIHHVGVAVADLEEAIATWERLFGARLVQRAALADDGVEAALLLVGGNQIELVSPIADDTPVARFLAKRGPGMHHLAFDTADVGATLQELSDAGAELVDSAPRRGLFGLEIAFVHPDSAHGVLTEIVSVPSDTAAESVSVR